MHTQRNKINLSLLALVLGFVHLVAPLTVYPKDLPAKFMASSEVEVGMKITGKTCFRGVEIEEFTGEIVGIEHGAFAGSSVIWALLESPELGPHGVAQGMSGSPCYVDGRMIGAVAYGYGFSQKPLCGITPIESMLEVLELTNDDPHPFESELDDGAATVGVWDIETLRDMAMSARPPMGEPARLSVNLLPEALRPDVPDGATHIEMIPLSMPIGVSQCPPSVYGPLSDFFKECNLSLIPGAISGGTLNGADMPPLEDGSAIGIPFMTGDLTMGAYGTVTYCEGDRLIGFGHPAFGWGNADIPLSPCSMFMVNASYSTAFKMGEVATPTGAVRQDRLYGIGGVIGRVPRHIPMRVKVTGQESGVEKEFNYSIWDNRYFTPQMVSAGLSNAVESTDRPGGDCTVRATYTIGLEGQAPVAKRLYYASTSSPGGLAGFELYGDVALLLGNPFRKAKITSVEAEIEISTRVKQAAIVSVAADKDVYRPGETASLSVLLQPFRGERERKQVDFELDKDLRDGVYQLFVGDSSARMSLELSRAPGLFKPMNFEQMAEALRRHYLGDEFYVVLSEFSRGLTIQGQEMPALPPSILSAMSSAGDQALIGPATSRFLSERVIKGATQFVGAAKLTISVNRAGKR